MCCFSRSVKDIRNTRIFARGIAQTRQVIVYSMKITADEDLAMILPIPVRQPAKEDAVRFINLKEYPEFFVDLEEGFPPRPVKFKKDVRGFGAAGGLLEEKLVVVDVGDFIASFVPTVADFARVDEKFKLPPGVWDKLPAYKDYGFAVFQLNKGAHSHPMAFDFPRRNPRELFFPTVHIHDGTVHEKAEFDHILYCQARGKMLMEWQESVQPARMFMKKHRKFPGIFEPDDHCYRLEMKGELQNVDTLV